ncbi:MAG: GNAT family N-acetyltransferase [Candidatus Pacebacteria bacterium]|nr:GNAT family N-acetyltransferase [Candidatus Paceibacterota bacterium]
MEAKDITKAQQFCTYKGIPSGYAFSLWYKRLEEKCKHSFLIDLDGTSVGFIGLDQDKDTEMYELGIYLGEEYQHKGIGKEAMKLLLDFCKENNIKKLYAKVDFKNRVSMKFLFKFGFKPAYILMGKLIE